MAAWVAPVLGALLGGGQKPERERISYGDGGYQPYQSQSPYTDQATEAWGAQQSGGGEAAQSGGGGGAAANVALSLLQGGGGGGGSQRQPIAYRGAPAEETAPETQGGFRGYSSMKYRPR